MTMWTTADIPDQTGRTAVYHRCQQHGRPAPAVGSLRRAHWSRVSRWLKVAGWRAVAGRVEPNHTAGMDKAGRAFRIFVTNRGARSV
jgi:hypothetical protein